MIKNMICIEVSKQDMKITVYFEIHKMMYLLFLKKNMKKNLLIKNNSPMANGKDKKMTPEEWKKVEDALSSPYGRVEFKIDGYDITIMCVVEKPLHYCLAVYVDGKIKGEWISQDCEIRLII